MELRESRGRDCDCAGEMEVVVVGLARGSPRWRGRDKDAMFVCCSVCCGFRCGEKI